MFSELILPNEIQNFVVVRGMYWNIEVNEMYTSLGWGLGIESIVDNPVHVSNLFHWDRWFRLYGIVKAN